MANTTKDEKINSPTCFSRLENMKNIGFKPKTIMDCGASVGYWAWNAHQMFPKSKIIAIEPNPLIINKLKDMLSKMKKNPIIIEAAVGEKNQSSFLNVWDNEETKMSGSSLKGHVQGEPKKKLKIEVRTIDSICNELKIKPDFIKLDLQGGELEALKGAEETIKSTELVVTEFGVLEAYIDRSMPHDLINYFDERDFILYDIVDLLYRPYDNALTGGDFFFIKKDSKLREYKGFK